MSEPARGQVDLQRAVEEGKDPNADLEPAREPASRAESAVTLRIAGASYGEIARTLGYSHARYARAAVERTLAGAGRDPDDRAHLVELTDRRLDRLLRSVMPDATNPRSANHLAYSARALAIIDRQIRLHGLDAPTHAIVHTPDAEKVEAYITQVLTLAGAQGQAEEGDILDADVEEDDDGQTP